MGKHEDLHLYDSELAGLARRNYQGGMPIQLLADAFVYEPAGRYFHTKDGRFAKIWSVSAADISLFEASDLFGVGNNFKDVLNKYPAGSTGQFIRHTHRDIRPILDKYESIIHPEAGEFATEIARSIISRQQRAAVSPRGFFGGTNQSMLDRMRAEEIAAMGGEAAPGEEDTYAPGRIAVEREIREGRFPFVTDCYLIFHWTPSYLFGRFIDSAAKTALASVGLVDPNQLVHETASRHAKQFGAICHDIEQTLSAHSFNPSVITGQGYIDLHYQLLNPVRCFDIPPPRYRADIPIMEALQNPDSVPNRASLMDAASFAWVESEPEGMTIHDRGVPYYIRPVSVLGKPGRSFPGMLQQRLTGIESENLITLNWSVPGPAVVNTRLALRGRMIASKESMRIGDADTRAQQRRDLDMVKSKITSENVSSKEQFFDLSLHVNLMGFDKETIDDQAQQLETLLWNVGHKEVLRGDAVVRNSLPLNFRATSMRLLKRSFPHLTESVAHMAPLYVEYQGVGDAAIMMNNRSGQPIFLDLWGEQVNTAHSLVCGGTGTGKSFTFNNLLIALRVKYKPKVWIIDKGDSYESLCLVLAGNYVRLATEPFQEPTSKRMIHPICVNPFALLRNDKGEIEPLSLDDKLFIARMLIMMMEAGDGTNSATSTLPKLTVSLLYDALTTFYDNWLETRPDDEPRFSDFIPVLQATDMTELKGQVLVDHLRLYYGHGPFAALFDGYLQVDWDNDFTVLETQRMAKSPALGVVTLALFRQIDLYCKFKLSRDRKKIIAVDEAWSTLSDPNAASALSSFYRELRRYGAGCLLISQTVKDFANLISAEASGGGDSEDGILENTSHYFFLACSESDYKIAKEVLSFQPVEVDLWRSLASLPPMYSEVFYRMRTKQGRYYSGVFRLFSTPMTLWIASSHPDDYRMRELKTTEIVERDRIDESTARQQAVLELSKTHPYGARYGQAV